MAGRWLHLVAAALLGLICNTYGSDVVHSDVAQSDYSDDIYTTTAYPTQTEPQEALSCYDCTSYMPSCKRTVTDGHIVSRTGCKTKCFLRVGEEQSGALYRGCMDDFLSAQLDQDYVGCKVQEWNGRKSLWCLCDGDLCNGKSMKNLFYYGYGSAYKGQVEPEGKAYLGTHEDRFDEMTGSLDNYNEHYAIEPKMADAATGEAVEEPLGAVAYEENVVKEVKEPEVEPYGDYQTDQPQAYEEQGAGYIEQLPVDYSEPHLEEDTKQDTYDQALPEKDQQAYNVEPKAYETELQPNAYEEQPHGDDEKPEGYTEHHHESYPDHLPVYPGPHGEQYLPARFLSQQVHLPPFYPPYHGYPVLNAQQKYHGENKAEEYSEGEQQEGEKTPEGKSAEVPNAVPGYPHPLFYNYPYQYQNGRAEINLEPVNYFPYEHPNQATNHGEATLEEKTTQVEATAPSTTEAELDSELFCPSAGIFTYEEDCSKFVMCLIDHIHGRPRMYVMKCPASLVFDSAANTCMKPEMSDGCRRQPPKVDDAVELPAEPEVKAPEGEYKEEAVLDNRFEKSNIDQGFEYHY